MTHETDLKEFAKAADSSASQALEVVKNQIGWLEYVNEDEMQPGERQRILDACQRFFVSIRPFTRKYID